ncbi:MAG TPA: G5 domain-containing protein, partial [Candidatus Saccharimonadales bacterium]|nr:G5 domain-containing protein [Candidatus Saccharimonadales bacterium]
PIVEDNFRVNVYHARPVTVIDGDRKVVTLTAQKSARTVAQDAGLKIHHEDIANFSEGNIRNNVIGEQVVVSRATPITLNLYGTQVPTYTLAKQVKNLLSEKHIKLGNGETVNPSLDTAIKAGMEVFILSKGSHVLTTKEPIPIPTQVVNDASLSFGTTVTRQKGSAGEQVLTYLVSEKNGKEVSRKLIQRAVVQPPVPKVVARGTTIDINADKTAIMSSAGISSGNWAYANFIISHESNWHVTAENYSGAYGLCQALPGSKMASAGSDWATNPITQLRWCSGYASRAYGGWANAYYHWLSYSSW